MDLLIDEEYGSLSRLSMRILTNNTCCMYHRTLQLAPLEGALRYYTGCFTLFDF